MIEVSSPPEYARTIFLMLLLAQPQCLLYQRDSGFNFLPRDDQGWRNTNDIRSRPQGEHPVLPQRIKELLDVSARVLESAQETPAADLPHLLRVRGAQALEPLLQEFAHFSDAGNEPGLAHDLPDPGSHGRCDRASAESRPVVSLVDKPVDLLRDQHRGQREASGQGLGQCDEVRSEPRALRRVERAGTCHARSAPRRQ